MWIFLNDGFFSIIEPPKGTPGDRLLVRARNRGDIERVFGLNVKVQRTPNRDYLYRALLDRTQVAVVIANHIAAIDYGNFKDSIPDQREFDLQQALAGPRPPSEILDAPPGRQSTQHRDRSSRRARDHRAKLTLRRRLQCGVDFLAAAMDNRQWR